MGLNGLVEVIARNDKGQRSVEAVGSGGRALTRRQNAGQRDGVEGTVPVGRSIVMC